MLCFIILSGVKKYIKKEFPLGVSDSSSSTMISKQIVLSAFLCSVLALDDPRVARLLHNEQEQHSGTGHYFFRFESSDGIFREEEGNLLDPNVQDSPVIVKGSYSYTDDTGKVYTVRYIADENGFHPEGDHIHTPNIVINSNQGNPIVVSTTPRPQIPIQFIRPSPRPQFIASPPRIQVPFSTTPRPEITTPTRIQIPLNEQNSGVTPFAQLDPKVQNSIVGILSNGYGRGFNIPAVNSL